MWQWKSANQVVSLLLVFCLIAVIAPSASRTVHRCELARTIRDHTTLKETWNIKQLVCIADQVSKFNTSAEVFRMNNQRSVGIFQIPSRFYCHDKPPMKGQAGLCHKLCKNYLDDDIVDDVFCASVAFKRSGFRFWKVWYHQCYRNKNINDYLEGCDLE